MKACCGFGHRDVFENIKGQIEEAVLMAIRDGCEIFYTGAMGVFDALFSSAVRKAKKSYPHIKLICVKPYMTGDINTDRDLERMLKAAKPHRKADFEPFVEPRISLCPILMLLGYFCQPIYKPSVFLMLLVFSERIICKKIYQKLRCCNQR